MEQIPTNDMILGYNPLPGSKKIYRPSERFDGIQVPFRKIELTATQKTDGTEEENTPVCVYDTSGPYTDPDVQVDIQKGLNTLRQEWIVERDDVEELSESTSMYRQRRENDASLDDLRFPHTRKPYRAKPGQHVTQMHDAKKGIMTKEIE